MSDPYILTATFPLGTINKNGDVFTFQNISGFPIESGAIVFTHVVSKEVFQKYVEDGKNWYVSMECLFDNE